MTDELEQQFDAAHRHLPKCDGLTAYLGMEPNRIVDAIKDTIIKYKGDPADVAAHAFRLGTLVGYLYAQKEATSDKRDNAGDGSAN